MLSKPILSFKEPHQPCAVLHPWTSRCFLSFLDIFFNSFRGSAKFFILVNVLPSLLKEGFHPENVKKQILGLGRSCMFGAVAASFSISSICLLRNVLGRYHVLSVGLIPGILGGIGIFLEEPTRKTMSLTTYIALVSDLVLRILSDNGHLVMTRSKEFFLFAIGSSLLLYCIRKYKKSYSVLWPFVPFKLTDGSKERKICPHKGKCEDCIKQSFRRFFFLALAFQIVKLTTTNFTKIVTNPLIFFKVLFEVKNLRLPMFAGIYIGVFQAVSCLLVRLRGRDEAWQALVAGGLASLTFPLHPNLSLTLIAYSNIFQILFREHVRSKLPDWPWESLVFMALLGVLFHARIADPKSVPSYMHYIMDTVMTSRGKEMYDLLENHVIIRQ